MHLPHASQELSKPTKAECEANDDIGMLHISGSYQLDVCGRVVGLEKNDRP